MMVKERILHVVVMACMILGFAPSPTVARPQSVRDYQSATRDNTALVLVNASSPDYADFQHYIQPYLDHFGIPYTALDIATASVSSTALDKAVIIIGHRQLDPGNSYLDATEQAAIVSAVDAGTGLVNFDNDLWVDSSTPRYAYVQNIFSFGYDAPAAATGVSISSAEHYITERHTAGESISTAQMTPAGVTAPSAVTVLATTGSQPFLAVTTHGAGRAVQWGTYAWMSHAVKGPLLGLDDLVWRSIVWAARKPFVMQGLPPFVTMRMDDVSGPLWWMQAANDFGFIPWAGIFTSDIDATEYPVLRDLVQAGKATTALHAYSTNDFFYFNHQAGTNWTDQYLYGDDGISGLYANATKWFDERHIPMSRYLVPHYYEIGSNAFAGLQTWGTEFVGTMMDPGQLESSAPWMKAGPFRLYEDGAAYDRGQNPYYAGFMTIPGHSEMNGKFFNCVSEIRDVTGYEWLGNNRTSPAQATQDGTAWLKRALDGMDLATLFSHEYTFINTMSQEDWRATLQAITQNIASYQPIYVSMDHACQYLRAMHTSDISASTYDPASRRVTTTFSGKTDLETKYYLFTENGGAIEQSLASGVPIFDGTQVVTFDVPAPSVLDHFAFDTIPSPRYAGLAFPVALSARDSSGNLVTSYTGQATVSANTGTIQVSGPANFTAGRWSGYVTVDQATTGVTLLASDGSVTGTSNAFDVNVLQCPCSIWEDPVTPANPSVTDNRPIEVGVRFRSEIDGYITGVRFYKGPSNTGTHVGHLWTNDGTLLAEVTFTGESASSWQEAFFGTPVAITAGTTYVASYYSPAGYFANTPDYFSTGFDNPPLHALAAGVDGPNGVYRYDSSGFPTESFAGHWSNYWVDVVLETQTGTDTTPPAVSLVLPVDGATEISLNSDLRAVFSEGVNATTITGSTFELRDAASALVAASVVYDASTRTARLTPSRALYNSATYTATVKGGTAGVKDLAGNPMVADYTWTFTTAAAPPPPPDEGPGGPILVVASAANPFGRYYGEILRNEGLNEFTVTDISRVTAQVLAGHDVVILGEMPLTPAQVTLFSDWVTAGGNLIAMRPDRQLTDLLGLTDAAATLGNAYLLVDPTSGPGVGIVGQTIQFHGIADLYGLNGATPVATLYSAAGAATAYPAVTLRSVGALGGQAAAFTYDLARSVVYTRQGNPAWSGEKRTSDSGPIRGVDLFYPEWVDLNKVAIPQADEQQRLLANLILQMNADKKPLPRWWYFPRDEKAVVLMTGDDHNGTGSAGRFDIYKANSPANCSVSDWECVRSTAYLLPTNALTDTEALAYTAEGFEVGLHVDTGCLDWTPASLTTAYADQMSAWRARYPGLATPASERTHCVAWSDWDTQARVQLNQGIRLDTNYYYWPSEWVLNRPGLFTGSGLPMRFAGIDGGPVDVYQAVTQMTDESGQSYPATIEALLDRALGSEGYYGVFTANMHHDNPDSAGAIAIISAALARGVPVVSGRQMLQWLDGRNGSAFGSITWSDSTLHFTVTAGAGANGLRGMLPARSLTRGQDGQVHAGRLSAITLEGAPVSYSVQTIKGIEYALFAAASGSYAAIYEVDVTPPAVSQHSPAANAEGVSLGSTVTVEFNEPMAPETINVTTIRLRADGATSDVAATVTYDAATRTATLDPGASLAKGTVYGVTVDRSVADIAGNPLGTDFTWAFRTVEFECPCSIWSANTVPVTPEYTDWTPNELGVKFKSTVSGYITGIRFYKSAKNTGPFEGHLWSLGGTPLATATFGQVTETGWQEASFPNPVAISANTIYVASYFTQSGYYAFDQGYFTNSGVTNPPLRALQNTEDGQVNGVIAYGGSGFPDKTYNASNYWVDVVFNTTLPGDTTPPVVSAVTVSPGSGSTSATISWTTNEASSSRVDYGTDAGTLNQSSNDGTLVTAHSLTLTGLTPDTTYYYRVTSVDQAGNAATYPAAGSAPSSFTLPAPRLGDTLATDFAAGTIEGCYVSQAGNGAFLLNPTLGSEFDGTTLPGDWSQRSWDAGGNTTVGDGALKVDGALAETTVSYGRGRSLEFGATFQGVNYQTAGFGGGSDTYNVEPWAAFGTAATSDHLYARTYVGGVLQNTDLGGTYLGAPHRYRIDWQATGVAFYVDGQVVATHTVGIAGPMRVAFSDAAYGGPALSVDWARLSPYAATCTFTSRVLNGGTNVRWLKLISTGDSPTNTSVSYETRAGNTSAPDASWTAWTPVAANGDVASPESQYIQYRATVTTSDNASTPVIDQVDITYSLAPVLSSLNLQPGWNLVSFPILPADTNPSALFAGIQGHYDLVYAWDAVNGRWLRHAPGVGYGDTLLALNNRQAFWIRVTGSENVVLQVQGSGPAATPIPLTAGWNLVGYPARQNHDLPGALQEHGVGPDFSLVYAYHPGDSTNPWRLYDNTAGSGYTPDLTALAPGWGYWVKVSAGREWVVNYLVP